MNTDSNEGRMKLYRTSSDSNGHANGSSLSPPEHRTDPLTYSDASTRGRDKARGKGPVSAWVPWLAALLPFSATKTTGAVCSGLCGERMCCRAVRMISKVADTLTDRILAL